ncbi:MAG TPA: ABC transporter ATP-binding protein [Myxococcaceae bacterium]|nr:ABC transporter ATP-binding protein [Myxococcaceae bacterium]
MAEPLLEIRELKTQLRSSAGAFTVVDGVSLSIGAGATLGVVGESGSGKSMTALSILRLVPEPAGRIVGGEILFRGRNLLALSEREMRQVRGREISMVFQEPMTSLNPVFTVGEQIAEAIRLHQGLARGPARAKSIDMLTQVGIPSPERRVDAYPHELSGGMRQRVMIAMALACDPALLIADEPTTALDVTIQAQVLDLLRRLQEQRRMAVLLITHDLGVVAESCDEVAVMYAGRIVERAPVRQLFARPAHPYTAGLLRSIPAWDAVARSGERLKAIPGTVPNLRSLPAGCRFRDRCDRPIEPCARLDPPLAAGPDGRLGACHNPVPP